MDGVSLETLLIQADYQHYPAEVGLSEKIAFDDNTNCRS
jgi:hypothetical protein